MQTNIASDLPINLSPLPYALLTSEHSPDAALWTGEWLLQAQAPSLFAWVPQSYAVVLGASQTPEKEVHLDVLRERAWPLCKRRGGGGAVLLGPHCLCLGIRLPRQSAWSPLTYFKTINRALAKSLNHLLPDSNASIQETGISDLAIGSLKIAGTSLYLSRDIALYLASILIEANRQDIEAVLKHPSREPDYRSGRPHGDFILGLKEAGLQLDNETLKQKVTEDLRLALASYF